MTTRSSKPSARPAAKERPGGQGAKGAPARKTAKPAGSKAARPTPAKPAAKAAPARKPAAKGASAGVVYASALREMIARRLGRI